MLKVLVALFCGALSAHSETSGRLAASRSSFVGEVVSVADGDTLSVDRPGTGPVRVRLYGVDAPEGGQAYSSEATTFVEKRALGETVSVEARDVDVYGRLVAEVRLAGGESLNRALVRDGWAWWYRRYAPDDAELERLEREARALRAGIWRDPDPVEPWRFRRGEGASFGSVGLAGSRGAADDEVYVTRTGKKYHRGNCRSLRRSRIAMPLERARERFQPCAICRPP